MFNLHQNQKWLVPEVDSGRTGIPCGATPTGRIDAHFNKSLDLGCSRCIEAHQSKSGEGFFLEGCLSDAIQGSGHYLDSTSFKNAPAGWYIYHPGRPRWPGNRIQPGSSICEEIALGIARGFYFIEA